MKKHKIIKINQFPEDQKQNILSGLGDAVSKILLECHNNINRLTLKYGTAIRLTYMVSELSDENIEKLNNNFDINDPNLDIKQVFDTITIQNDIKKVNNNTADEAKEPEEKEQKKKPKSGKTRRKTKKT